MVFFLGFFFIIEYVDVVMLKVCLLVRRGWGMLLCAVWLVAVCGVGWGSGVMMRLGRGGCGWWLMVMVGGCGVLEAWLGRWAG